MSKGIDYDKLIEIIYARNELITRRLKYKGVEDYDIPDLAIRIMLKAVSALYQLRNPKKLDSWLLAITENEANKYFRDRSAKWNREISAVYNSQTGEEVDIYETIPDEITIEIIMRRAEERNEINKLLLRLSEKERSVFLLRNLEKYKFKEIADGLGLNESTVRSHYRRSILKMRKYIDEME